MANDNQSNFLDSAYERAVPHEIPSLFTNFFSAATILRIARFNGELVVSEDDENESLDHFFTLLNTIENNLQPKHRKRSTNGDSAGPFIIVVEGLDGTGKSSLVEALAQQLKLGNNAKCIATRTPSKALKAARAIFDKRGGSVARAFYMVCNYVLQHEIQQLQDEILLNDGSGGADENQQERKSLIVVVDRWYSSTCAYSVGQHTEGGAEGIDALQDDSLFQWPFDLEPPALVLLLEADNTVRSQRVRSRNLPVDLSEWDDRLAKNEQLCQRIQQCFKRVTGPRETLVLDANLTKEKVLHNALSIVKERQCRHFTPEVYFKDDPLQYLKWQLVEERATLHCNSPITTMVLTVPQLLQGPSQAHFPCAVLFVEVIKVESAGIVFTAASMPVESNGCSIVSLSYISSTQQKQHCWTMNGVCSFVTQAECEMLQIPTRTMNNGKPCQVYRCCPIEVSCLTNGANDSILVKRKTRTGWIDADPSPTSSSVINAEDDHPKMTKGSAGSNAARALSPQKAITLVLVGTHCSGKSTISKRLSEVLEWPLDPELGDILRDKERLVAGGHTVGDGSGIQDENTALSWDERILKGECARDLSRSGVHRVVETHHFGNLAWAGLRKPSAMESTEVMKEVCYPYRQAIELAMDHSHLVVIHLKIDVEAALRRRADDDSNRTRLPFTDEESECTSLHTALQTNGSKLMQNVKPDDVSFIEIDNSVDGQKGMEETLQRILEFLNQNRYLACQNLIVSS